MVLIAFDEDISKWNLIVYLKFHCELKQRESVINVAKPNGRTSFEFCIHFSSK